MDAAKREELEKLAHEKLAQANRLIDEAGELAKEGQFPLHFGEIGDFIPRAAVDRELLRERAIENLKRDGRSNGHDKVLNEEKSKGSPWPVYDYVARPVTPWDEITDEDEREAAIDKEIEDIMDNMDIPYEFREYGSVSEADAWWHPSRC